MSTEGHSYGENDSKIIQGHIAPNLTSLYKQHWFHDADQNDIITGFLQDMYTFLCERLDQPNYPKIPALKNEVKYLFRLFLIVVKP